MRYTICTLLLLTGLLLAVASATSTSSAGDASSVNLCIAKCDAEYRGCVADDGYWCSDAQKQCLGFCD